MCSRSTCLGDIGLSPRVRGSPLGEHREHRHYGSIPACAGQPSRPSTPEPIRRVYPRVCGAAAQGVAIRVRGGGLSPRVRGSRVNPSVVCLLSRSIPACAGQPRGEGERRMCQRVYPRVCGAASSEREQAEGDGGLSPRVRGSHQSRLSEHDGLWSIPACAGQPPAGVELSVPATVYPRVCGAASSTPAGANSPQGLSPRVRGSRYPDRRRRKGVGSIPACAGQPGRESERYIRRGVYPRVCGAAASARRPNHRNIGLSPRVRGSRLSVRPAAVRPGSIPACAGQPVG